MRGISLKITYKMGGKNKNSVFNIYLNNSLLFTYDLYYNSHVELQLDKLNISFFSFHLLNLFKILQQYGLVNKY